MSSHSEAFAKRLARRAGLAWVGCAFALVFAISLALAVEPGHVSRTSQVTCEFRAIGSKDPDPKTRNPDYLAEKFAGHTFVFADEIARIRRQPRKSYFYVTARTKHIDGLLQQTLENGASQVVILGAGLDSRGFRFHKRFPTAKFFELDLPATQDYKRTLVEKSVGKPPVTLIFTPIDFNKETLGQVLAKAGYNPRAKTFFIWEGVTYYISAAAVDGTLRFIAENSAPGSSVVFDYTLEEVVKGDYRRFPKARQAMSWLETLGEPWVFGIADGKSQEYVSKRGLRVLSDLDPDEMTRRYLITSGGEVYGPLPGYMRIMHAEVP
jgi:methyltransferase (TIGR00027 family)